MKQLTRLWGAALWLTLLLAGCGGTPFEPQDSAPDNELDPALIKDAVPRREVITRAGNKSPYTVLGKTYRVMDDPRGYRQRGIASWYGSKFHGRPTANGERYNLYAMTAAHRSLPIPCYVRVTNLENGKSTVVRVNDRGPFHHERVIDLSYAAAVKLGFARKGTALVEIALIDVDNEPARGVAVNSGGRHFLQAGAFQSRQLADSLQRRLSVAVQHPVTVEAADTQPVMYRVRIGPLANRDTAEQLRRRLLSEHLAEAQIISE